MAPTVCLSELPVSRSSVSPFARRRHRAPNGGISKQQRLELRRLDGVPNGTAPLTPPESPHWDPAGINDPCPPIFLGSVVPQLTARVPADLEEQWKLVLARREGLLDIVVRTMALVRRNNILQEKVNALRAETSEFIRSVMNNPENKSRQKQLEENRKEAAESSGTEEVQARPTLPPTPDSLSSASTKDDASSCCCSDWDSELSSDEEP